MIGTYAAVVAICAASLAIGQAAIGLCGARRWSWPAPAVGLALVCAVCWGTVRLPGDGVVSALAVLVLTIAAVAYLWGRVEGTGEALAAGWPVALGALLATALPFVAEGHFGILGTSFNPDMSQHLLAADRLAEGNSSQLLVQGYPLGPHAIVVALNKGLGVGLVQGFTGLTIAVAILASLTALAAFRDLPALPRTTGALLVGLAYLVASYFAQGAFKETMQALYLLAFVLALREAESDWTSPLRFVPAALIAVGSVYTYSFPGLIWLGGAAVLWAIFTRPAIRALGLALLTFFVLIAPEIGRLIDFKQFETFDPNGPGLGNLFGQISPFAALGIWPSGDFRLAPGDGAVPAVGYYLGVAFALALFIYGLVWLWRRRESAILSGLAAAALAYAAARTVGTPYTAAKALEIGAPLVALAILLPLLSARLFLFVAEGQKGTGEAIRRIAAGGFVVAAGVCSLLALANAPVGPTSYSSALSEYRRLVGEGPTLVVASPRLLQEEHGTPFLNWELRGGRVCIASYGEEKELPPGIRFVIWQDFEGADWALRKVSDPLPGRSPCPLIAVRQARQGPAR
ncbi:MAG TPA: hypothetical protein VGK41_02845 [Solirubrobacterales bacterium]